MRRQQQWRRSTSTSTSIPRSRMVVIFGMMIVMFFLWSNLRLSLGQGGGDSNSHYNNDLDFVVEEITSAGMTTLSETFQTTTKMLNYNDYNSAHHHQPLPPDKDNDIDDCNHSLECSLNGCLIEGIGCQCRKPWSGVSCSVLLTKPSPPSAKSLYNNINNNNNDNKKDEGNTWSGPVHQDRTTGKFHMYLPLYNKGSLVFTKGLLHGISDQVTGPYQWNMLPINPGVNPGFLVYPKNKNLGLPPLPLLPNNNNNNNATTMGSEQQQQQQQQYYYALLIGGQLWTDDSLDGNFTKVVGEYPHINFSPIFYNNTYYGVFQSIDRIYNNSDVTKRNGWELYSTIELQSQPQQPTKQLQQSQLQQPKENYWTKQRRRQQQREERKLKRRIRMEDPFLWIDQYHHWHIITHEFDKRETTNCSTSRISAHLFSINGTSQWYKSNEAPYGHTIHYTDGTSQTYSTLERPYVVFEQQQQDKQTELNNNNDYSSDNNFSNNYYYNPRRQQPTHIILAATPHFGNDGCSQTKDCMKNNRYCSCVNCKWLRQTTTVVLSLDTT